MDNLSKLIHELKFLKETLSKSASMRKEEKTVPYASQARMSTTARISKGGECMEMSEHGQWSLTKQHIGFKPLESKLVSEGNSVDSAKKIAASVGTQKYGKQGMEERAHKTETNEKAGSSRPHTKNVQEDHMELAPEKQSPKVYVKGQPYNGKR